jgi:hypothetical protein
VRVRAAPTVTVHRLCGGAIAVERFRATLPSLGHPVPCGLAPRIARELCHFLAVGGMPEKFFRRVHGRSPDGQPCTRVGPIPELFCIRMGEAAGTDAPALCSQPDSTDISGEGSEQTALRQGTPG